MRSFPISRPILDLETRNPRELIHIPRHKRQIMHQSDCGDLHVVGADHASLLFQKMPDFAILFRRRIIEWKRRIYGQHPGKLRFPSLRDIIFFRAMKKLRFNSRARGNLFSGAGRNALKQHPLSPLENLDPYIGVKKVSHHQTLAGGRGSSLGSSNSISAHAPINSASSGRRFLISSRLMAPSSSAADITSRIFPVRRTAFSSGSFRSKDSSSVAIAVTPRECHQFPPFPIQFFPKASLPLITDH